MPRRRSNYDRPATSIANGSTYAWRQVRQLVLQRDGWQCHHCRRAVHPRCNHRYCGQCAEVDHWPVRRELGGTDDPGNLVAACRRCNRMSPERRRLELARLGDAAVAPEPRRQSRW